MKRMELFFERPDRLQATAPPEARGIARDEVRLLVSSVDRHVHTQFTELANHLTPGDLLVVNRSATIPASLTVTSYSNPRVGAFTLNFSTNYGGGLWLVEPRWSSSRPGPLPLTAGETILVGGLPARLVSTHPGLERLWFLQGDPQLENLIPTLGKPIRYGYVNETYSLDAYQTIFGTVPGSAEMPSAGRPFTQRVLDSLTARGINIVEITLHTGVSSLEIETDAVEEHPMYAEPFEVTAATANAVNKAHENGQRVVAVGTTVVRALESAWDGTQVQANAGFTRLMVHPERGVHTVDGLITGLHDPLASHLAMLYAVAGRDMILAGYEEAVAHEYLWHEFGDSHLILPER